MVPMAAGGGDEGSNVFSITVRRPDQHENLSTSHTAQTPKTIVHHISTRIINLLELGFGTCRKKHEHNMCVIGIYNECQDNGPLD